MNGRHLALMALCAIALLAALPASSSDGTITLSIVDDACKNAPNIQAADDPHGPIDCKRNTMFTIGIVEINIPGEFYAHTAYVSTNNKGVCLMMSGPPAPEKRCTPSPDGHRLLEADLMGANFHTLHVEDHSPGDEIASLLADHYGKVNPRQLPIFRNVNPVIPERRVDGRQYRVGSEITLEVDIDWVVP